jgi:hypothetical protein
MKKHKRLTVILLIVAGTILYWGWTQTLVSYTPPQGNPKIGNTEYYQYSEIESHTDRTIGEITTSEDWPTIGEWRQGFEVFVETGVLYPFQQNWRGFLKKYPGTQFPYIELRLKTRNESGEVVDFSSCTLMSFEWISKDLNYDECQARTYPNKPSKLKLSSEAWRLSEAGDKSKIIEASNVELLSNYDAPDGVRRVRIPVLPELLDSFGEYYPELAGKYKKYNYIYAYLICGEWYRAKIYMRNEDISGQYRDIYSSVGSDDGHGRFLLAYFKTPAPGIVKQGQILPIDLLVVPDLYPPFNPMSDYRKEKIARGEHIIPRRKYMIPRFEADALRYKAKLLLQPKN